MKLFSATEIKEKAQRQEAEKQFSLIELHNKKSVLMKQLADLEATKKEMIEKFNKEYNEYAHKKKAEARLLENEVVALEKRREKALKPIDQLEQEAQNKMQDVIKAQSDLGNRETELEKQLLNLAERERETEKEEIRIRQQKQILKQETEDLEKDKKRTAQVMVTLNTKIDQFEEVKKEKEREFKKEEEQIRFEQTANESYKEMLDKREEEIEARERKAVINEKRLSKHAKKMGIKL